MLQKVFVYKNKVALISELEALKKELEEKSLHKLYFQIHTPTLDKAVITEVCDTLSSIFPDTPWIGNSSAGNIYNTDSYDDDILIAANIFESDSTSFKLLHYNMEKSSPSVIAKDLLKQAAAFDSLKAIELFWTISDFSASDLCEGLHNLYPNVQVFGAIACSKDITSSDSLVFSSVSGIFRKGVLFILFGGEDLFIDSIKINGWKPIGRNFVVTKAKGNCLYELSGIPAYNIYKKYLNIENDEHFFFNALDFPIMYEHNNTTISRAPSHSNADGSISLSSDIETGSIVRLSYGDPKTILSSIKTESKRIKEFQPEVMHVFSCAARKAYWEPYSPTYEIEELRGLSPMTGFFSHGEFIREEGFVNQHNITLVIAAMREGCQNPDTETLSEKQESSGRLPLAARMATFIRETSYELEEINSTLQIMNKQLEGLAATDGLTGLKNRLAFTQYLNDIYHSAPSPDLFMIMMDVNGLKHTNDTFGHQAGDDLIIGTARVINNVFGKPDVTFRIGGDEFAVIIEASEYEIEDLMNRFRDTIEAANRTNLYHLSVAAGYSRIKDPSGFIKSISTWKMDADLDMYRDKSLMHRRTSADPEIRNQKELIRCLITIEEAKDPYTANHSERVCALAEYIASVIGLTDVTIQNIRDAAQLHDIGKVGISDSILSKPTTLSAEEYAKIKEHPVIGARILMQSNYTQELVQIVLHHHEHYDGTGYPDNLSGDEIPIGARIVSIADSIDAMTSKRVYRDALSLAECRAEIENNLGRMYDPAIGELVLNYWDGICHIIESNC